MTKVKICGITNLEDAMLSAKFGADALGFNFYVNSPRYILPEVAREIIDELPENVLKVGVFVNEDLDKIVEIAKTSNLDVIQLHGEETPEFAKELKTRTRLEIIKAFRVSEDFKLENVLQYEVDAILLDAYSPKEHGGTGETFDWEIAIKVKETFPKMYLAGGLSGENVKKAIEFVRPFAVDVCSGLENNKGIKDLEKIRLFISKFNEIESSLMHTEKPEIADISNEELIEMVEGLTSTDYFKYAEKLKPKVVGKKVIDSIVGYSGFILLFEESEFVTVYLENEKLKWKIGRNTPTDEDVNLLNNSSIADGFDKFNIDLPYSNQNCSIEDEIANTFGKVIKNLAIGENSFNFCFEDRKELDSIIFQNENDEPLLRVFWEQW